MNLPTQELSFLTNNRITKYNLPILSERGVTLNHLLYFPEIDLYQILPITVRNEERPASQNGTYQYINHALQCAWSASEEAALEKDEWYFKKPKYVHRAYVGEETLATLIAKLINLDVDTADMPIHTEIFPSIFKEDFQGLNELYSQLLRDGRQVKLLLTVSGEGPYYQNVESINSTFIATEASIKPATLLQQRIKNIFGYYNSEGTYIPDKGEFNENKHSKRQPEGSVLVNGAGSDDIPF